MPVIKVNMYKAGTEKKVACTAYIVLKIVKNVEPEVRPETVTVPVGMGDIDYADLFSADEEIYNSANKVLVDWDRMNDLYEELELSHNDFVDIYGDEDATEVISSLGEPNEIGKFEINLYEEDVNSYAISFMPNAYSKFGENVVTYSVTPVSISYPTVIFEFKYNVKEPILPAGILNGYKKSDEPNTIITKGRVVNGEYEMSLNLGEAFNYGNEVETADSYNAMFRNPGEDFATGYISRAKHAFCLASAEDDKKPSFNGVAKNGTDILIWESAGVKAFFGTSDANNIMLDMGLADKLKENTRTYELYRRTTYLNGEVAIYNFKVEFVNPLTVEFTPSIKLIDKPEADIVDVAGHYKVLFRGKELWNGETPDEVNTIEGGYGVLVDLLDGDEGAFYALKDINTLYHDLTHLDVAVPGEPVKNASKIEWHNRGTRLTRPIVMGKMMFKFSTEFADVVSTGEAVNVKPSEL